MIELNIFQLLLLIGFGNSIILLFSFTQIQRPYRKPALFLGLFIVGNLIYQADFVLIPEIQRHLTLIIPKLPVLLFLPALFVFFVESSFDPDFTISGSRKLFLLPGVVDIGYQTGAWLYVRHHPSGPVHEFLTGRSGHLAYEGVAIIFSVGCMYYLLTYLSRSDVQKTRAYRFFRFVLAGLLLILLRWIGIYLLDFFAPGSYDFTMQYYFWLFDCGFLLYTGYKILTAPKILNADAGGFTVPNRDELRQFATQLKSLLTDEKLYLKPDLTRKDLAEHLDVSEVYVSSILNEGLQSSYYEVINRHRVKEAIRRIQAGRLDQITVEALAKEVGFKSKSTFYKAFKEHTGTTPTQYRGRR